MFKWQGTIRLGACILIAHLPSSQSATKTSDCHFYEQTKMLERVRCKGQERPERGDVKNRTAQQFQKKGKLA